VISRSHILKSSCPPKREKRVPLVPRLKTMQPRPLLRVPPRGIDGIVHVNPNDVLSGRGGRVNSHVGNIQFRDIIASSKKGYLAKTVKKLEKAHIASKIINDIRSMDPPGRFLKEDADTGLWFEILETPRRSKKQDKHFERMLLTFVMNKSTEIPPTVDYSLLIQYYYRSIKNIKGFDSLRAFCFMCHVRSFLKKLEQDLFPVPSTPYGMKFPAIHMATLTTPQLLPYGFNRT
jgi:hypothetical protein